MGGDPGAGLVWRGALDPTFGDEIGLAIAHAPNGMLWRTLQSTAGIETTHGETVIELTRRLRLNDWLVRQPDLQWVRDPDSDPTRRSTLGVALRFEIAADRAFTRAAARR